MPAPPEIGCLTRELTRAFPASCRAPGPPRTYNSFSSTPGSYLCSYTQAPYFFEVGNKLNELSERSPTFSDFLVRTFRTRYYELISKVSLTH